MPTEVEEAVARARQQSDAFMQQSRNQMLQTYQEQRAMFVGQAPGQSTGAGGLGQAPNQGTPAGRLLETINNLVRQGVQAGGGAVGTVGSGFAGVGAGMGAGIGFMGSRGPYGISGVQGGSIHPGGQQMGLGQTLFAGYGAGMPLGLGKYAGQRLDMTATQAQETARESLAYKMSGGLRSGFYGALSGITGGILGAAERREGTWFETKDLQYFAEQAQRRMRSMTTEQARRMGRGTGRGAFVTGINRDLAVEIGRQEARALGSFQAEMGLEKEEVNMLADAVRGTMGGRQYAELYAQKGAVRGAQEVGRQAGFAKEVMQTLHMGKEELQEFVKVRGEVLGSMEDLAKMARTSNQIAGRTGFGVREVNQMLTGFQMQGMQMGTGQAATGAAAMGMVERIGALNMAGGITREEMFRYGGTTGAQAAQRQVMVRMQQNLQMYQQGGLGGLGILAQDSQMMGRFMMGGTGYMGAMGMAGGMRAADPLVAMRASYDPAQQRQMATMGGRMAYQQSQEALRSGMFSMFGDPKDQQLMAMDMYRRTMGIDKLEARQQFTQYERERNIFRMEAEDRFGVTGAGARDQGQKMQGLYQRLMSRDLLGRAQASTGASSPMEATAKLYDQITKGGTVPIDSNKSAEDLMTEYAANAPRDIGPNAATMPGGWISQLGVFGKPFQEYGEGTAEDRGHNWRQRNRYERQRTQGLLMETALPEAYQALIEGGIGDAATEELLLGKGGLRIRRVQTAGQAFRGEQGAEERLRFTETGRLGRRVGNKIVGMTRSEMVKRYGISNVQNMISGWLNTDKMKGLIADPQETVNKLLAQGGKTRGEEKQVQWEAERGIDALDKMLPGLAGGPEFRDVPGVLRADAAENRASWITNMMAMSDEAGEGEGLYETWSAEQKESFARVQQLVRQDPGMKYFAGSFSNIMGAGWAANAGGLVWDKKVTDREGRVKKMLAEDDDDAYRAKMASIFKAGKVSVSGIKPEEWTAEKFADFQKDAERKGEYNTVLGSAEFLNALGQEMADRASKTLKLEKGDSPWNPLYVKTAGELTPEEKVELASRSGGS